MAILVKFAVALGIGTLTMAVPSVRLNPDPVVRVADSHPAIINNSAALVSTPPAATDAANETTPAPVHYKSPVVVTKALLIVQQPARDVQPANVDAQVIQPAPQQTFWDATNAPGIGETCWNTTQCLNQHFGDGGMADQGSTQTGTHGTVENK